jgi:hypothetical protein
VLPVFYTIYKTTNKVNGKFYIGKHQTKNLDDGYFGSGKHLRNAINKYGLENFDKEILFIFDKESEMNAKEAELVTEEFCLREDTYNLCPGGKGGWGYNNTTEGQKLREHSYVNWYTSGGASFKEKFEADEEFRHHHSEHLNNIRKIAMYKIKENYPLGTFHGKTHSEETKQRIGYANSKNQSGDKNSQFGTTWIYSMNEKRSIKISKEDSIPDGWYKGRKIKFD